MHNAEMASDNYSECFVIGIFRTRDKAEETAA